MKLLIVRHGDPDYTIDSLTEKGWKEVEFLSEKLSKLDIKDFYVSPLGRAKDTASLTLKKMNRTATECDWLREFDVLIDRPDVTDRKIILWDRTGAWTSVFISMITGLKMNASRQQIQKNITTMSQENLISFSQNMVMSEKDTTTESKKQTTIPSFSSAISAWNVCF